MEIILQQLNPHACRTYLLGTNESNEVAIIDPVLDHLNDYFDTGSIILIGIFYPAEIISFYILALVLLYHH